MTDEEMAEEEYKNCKFEKIEHYCDKAIYVTGFLAGLKAGRPQWHKVADGDLPKYCEEVYFIFDENPNLVDLKIIGRSLGYYNELEKEWYGYYKGCPCRIQNIIAWCEIPTFDKE